MLFRLTRLSNNPKLEEKERQIELQIQKEAKFLAPKAIAGQPLTFEKSNPMQSLFRGVGMKWEGKLTIAVLPSIFAILE
jgi:hypothetical protein